MMKQILSLMMALAVLLALPARATAGEVSDDETKDSRIHAKLNGLALIGIVNPAVEFRVMERATVQLEAIGIFYPSGFPGTDKPITVGAAFLEFRYYPKKAFQGFYAAPHAGWSVYRLTKGIVPGWKHTYPDSYQVGCNMMFGATLGYVFNLGKRWTLELSYAASWQCSRYEGFHNDGNRYVGLNGSGEWLPLSKCGVFVGYKF